MEQVSQAELLAQVAAEESGKAFQDVVRGFARQIILDSIAEEVNSLCGDKHYPVDGNEFRRAGSAPGMIYVEDSRVDVRRPRVRQRGADGQEVEHNLNTYEAAQDTEGLTEKILASYAAGVPTRSVPKIFPKAPNTSRSEVSRLWVGRGAELISTLRERDISDDKYVACYIDGIHLGKDSVAVAALGVTADGEKKVLDFEPGSSETAAVCQALLARLSERKMEFVGRPLFVIDGSQALRKGIKAVHPSALIQRCLVHLERNVKGYLSHKHYGHVSAMFKKIRQAQGGEEGRSALLALRLYLRKVNHQAWQCVVRVGVDAIMIHLLNVPNSLHITLLSTNNIENIFGTSRKKIGRVKRWDPTTEIGSRWMASALMEAEEGFRKVTGFKQIPQLISALQAAQKTILPGSLRSALCPPDSPSGRAPLSDPGTMNPTMTGKLAEQAGALEKTR